MCVDNRIMKARLLICPNAGSHSGESTKAYCFAYPDCEFIHICYRCFKLLIPTTTFQDFPEMDYQLGQSMIKENPHLQITGIE